MKPTVVITHRVHAEIIAMLSEVAHVIANESTSTLSREELLGRARNAHALMVFMPDCIDDAFLAACPHLKVIGAALKGYDNFDVPACTRRGIWFSIVPDLLTVPTAELTIGLLLALTRHVIEGDRMIREGRFQGWQPHLYGTGLTGKTLGIIGMGAVGQAIARRLAGFDMHLVYTDKRALDADTEARLGLERVSLDLLLQSADFVVPMLPMAADTLHLIDAAALARMKRGAHLINACRGSVVDEQAVAAALDSGQLAGYAADVFELEEWRRPDRPLTINAGLLADRARTVLTPHLGSAVHEVRLAIERHAARNIIEALSGRAPPSAINSVVRDGAASA